MDRWKREGLLSANNGLRNQVEDLLDAYQRQQGRLAETFRQLEGLRMRAHSPDRSVEVTVDASGVLTELNLTDSALRKTPGELARTIVDAVARAAGQVREHQHELNTSVAAEFEEFGDLSDIAPEAPELGDIRAYLRGAERPAE